MTVAHFRKLVSDETERLNSLCNRWNTLAAENENIPEKGILFDSFKLMHWNDFLENLFIQLFSFLYSDRRYQCKHRQSSTVDSRTL